MTSEIPETLYAKHLFFPAAALFAAMAPWLLVLSFYTEYKLALDPSEHAKSMLFGFIGALIAGYLLGRIETGKLLLLLLLWLIGRLLEVVGSNVVLLNLAYSSFGVFLACLVAPKFMVAKKWRNRAVAPLLAVIGLFPLLSWVLDNRQIPSSHYLHSFILLISLLMFFMGGRFITPLATRAFADNGSRIPHRVQPIIEAGTMLLLSLAFVLSLNSALIPYAGVMVGLAAMLILLRLYRWKLHYLNWRFIDIRALAIGYAMLGLGLLTFSFSLITGDTSTASLHIITIGAVGILSTCVIFKTMARQRQTSPVIYLPCIILISIAVVSRYSMPLIADQWRPLLIISSLAWSMNFTFIFLYCIKCLSDQQPG